MNGFVTPSNSTYDESIAVNFDGNQYAGFLWWSPGQGRAVAYHSSSNGVLTAQVLAGNPSSNFQDNDSSFASTALASSFLGAKRPVSFGTSPAMACFRPTRIRTGPPGRCSTTTSRPRSVPFWRT